MLEMWLSNEKLLSKSTHRFTTDDLTEQVLDRYSRLLHAGVFG